MDGNKTIDNPGKLVETKKTTEAKRTEQEKPSTVKDVVKETLQEQNNEFNQTTATAESTQQSATTTKNTAVASVNTTEKTETTSIAIEKPIDIAKADVPEKINAENVTVPSNNPTTSTVQPIADNISYASYNNDVAEEEEDGLLTEERQRKSGIAGFLKKAKRTLERKTGIQSSSSEVRFAVFAVNTQ